MLPTPGGQRGILLSRVSNVIGDEGAIGVALPLGMPGKANWFRRIILGRWEGRQFSVCNPPPNVPGFDRAVAVGTKQCSIEMGVLRSIQCRTP